MKTGAVTDLGRGDGVDAGVKRRHEGVIPAWGGVGGPSLGNCNCMYRFTDKMRQVKTKGTLEGRGGAAPRHGKPRPTTHFKRNFSGASDRKCLSLCNHTHMHPI